MLENVDDFVLYSSTLDGLETQIKKLVSWCRKINLKLSPAKFRLNTAVRFSGSVVSSERIKNNSVVFLDPPDLRVLAITEMKTPTNKR